MSFPPQGAGLIRRSGTATVSMGETVETVDHGLGTTPSWVHFTPLVAIGVDHYRGTIDATSFQICLASAQDADIDFAWSAEVR